jgi:hypothetical protein
MRGVQGGASGSAAHHSPADVTSPYWSAVGGIGALAAGAYLLSLPLPVSLWWWPWLCMAGGVLLLGTAALGAWLEGRR